MRRQVMSTLPVLVLALSCSGTSAVLADHGKPEIMRGTKIIGKSVQTMTGKEVGEIKDLAIDELDGQVRYAVLSFSGIAGAGEKYFAIPWEALQLTEDRQHFAVAVTEKELAKAPGFDIHNWPDFADPVYFATIHDFYSPSPAARGESQQPAKSSKSLESSKTTQPKKEK